MATQSTPAPIQSQSIPGSEQDKNDALQESANPGSENPGFANPDPIREDQVQNAVRFLSHPKVRGSPVAYRRSFLENKGLTKEEIDEAFRRVPDPSPSSGANAAAPVATQVAQPKPYTAAKPQVSEPMAVIAPPVAKRTMNWYHIVLATGLLTATGAGTAVFFKRVFVPRVKAWIRKVVNEREEEKEEEKKEVRIAQEAAEAAKAAASAAALVAKASQDLLSSKNEEKGYFEAFMKAMDVQVKEMKSMGETIKMLEANKNNNINNIGSIDDQFHSATTRNNGTVNNPWGNSSWGGQRGTTNNGLHSADYVLGRPNSSAPPTVEPVNLNPKSYNEMMSMGQQRGEKPPSLKPWEAGPQTKPTYTPSYPHSHSSDEGSNPDPQNPNPNPNPNPNYDASSEPWWRRKSVKVSEHEPDASDESAKPLPAVQVPYNPYASGSGQRRWVPPQPPAVAMPEAVAAIRQPKSKTVVDDDVAVKGAEVAVKGDEVARVEEGGSSGGVNEIVEEQESGNIEVN